MAEGTPYYKHDCSDCEYIGTLELSDLGERAPIDFYRCKQHGIYTTIARTGDGPDYISMPDQVIVPVAVQAASSDPGDSSALLLVMAGIAMAVGEEDE